MSVNEITWLKVKSAQRAAFVKEAHGFLAWWMWRTYYLANLPTANSNSLLTIRLI
ncbi:MAG: hypothetical protein WAK17_15525 [Candidatus Nitrosopolaris sp.]